MCLIIDKNSDYRRALNGFVINGVKYVRLLGTNGGIKNSTIVFVSERLAPELRRRIDNDRDKEKEHVPAKLEAYKALTCSASTPVSTPNGILIVNDAETEFTSDVLYLTDEGDEEPEMEYIKDYIVKLNASDGFGLMLPSLAQRWSEELELDYLVSGVNTRFAFEKGMAFTFDFLDFAENVAHTYFVKDAWGNTVDIRNVELILTTSMVKLWDSYKDCNDYLESSLKNGYTFGVTKACPEELESVRSLNYQFIQSYDFSDEDIEELIAPTIKEISGILGGDWRDTVLFVKGLGIERMIDRIDDDYIKAIMIDKRMLNDPFVQSNIYRLIKNRINEAKVGVIKVHGNYSIISGDPYLLCQSIFGLEKTGILAKGEIYNKYWADIGADKLACFRAPMTCHNNIRLVHPVNSDKAKHWYQYMTTCTILNSWDTITSALNGADFDGDIVMLTDNKLLVNKLKPLPALVCAQRKAGKVVPTEGDFVSSNIASFGNEIGQTTNWITSMFEVQAGYEPDSQEYETLSYRIRCGQLYQQNSIDKAKGIVCKPMPRSWHDRRFANQIEDEYDRKLYREIVADKKPYFMRYIYPSLMKQYNTYIKNTNSNALREFQMTVSELQSIPKEERTERQEEFLRYYGYRLPVGTNDCVMNKICKRFEHEFDGHIGKHNKNNPFDYTIMKSDAPYMQHQYNSILKLYKEYNKRLKSYAVLSDYERVPDTESFMTLSVINDDFQKECHKICPNESALCNIILDICYKRNSTKQFAWSMCGDEIINNLLKNNGNIISYPVMSPDGDVEFEGKKFKTETKEMV